MWVLDRLIYISRVNFHRGILGFLILRQVVELLLHTSHGGTAPRDPHGNPARAGEGRGGNPQEDACVCQERTREARMLQASQSKGSLY